MKKIISTALFLSLMLSTLVACGTPGGTTQETTAPADTTEAAETTTSDEMGERLDLPEDLKFDTDVHYLTLGSGSWATYDIWAEDITGEPINDAVWKRNEVIRNTLGVNIVEHRVDNIATELTKTIDAFTPTYDVVVANNRVSAQMLTKRQLIAFDELPYVDLNKFWWDQNAMNDMSIGGTVYFMTGDIVAMDNDAMMALMFNKSMLADLNGMTSPYQHIENNTWTIDKLLEMTQGAVRDVNGDQMISYQDDILGQSGSSITTEALFYGSGLSLIEKDAEDMPVLSVDVDKAQSFLDINYKICMDTNVAFNYTTQGVASGTMMTIFNEGRALFLASTLINVKTLREGDIDFGVVPYPKWDVAQDRYYLFTHFNAEFVSVPITVADDRLEVVGATLEMMAAKGQELLTPAYYDITLIGKGMRDKESEPMLDLMFANRVYDLGYIYDWGGVWTTLRTTAQSGSSTFASSIQRVTKVFNAQMEKTLDSIVGD